MWDPSRNAYLSACRLVCPSVLAILPRISKDWRIVCSSYRRETSPIWRILQTRARLLEKLISTLRLPRETFDYPIAPNTPVHLFSSTPSTLLSRRPSIIDALVTKTTHTWTKGRPVGTLLWSIQQTRTYGIQEIRMDTFFNKSFSARLGIAGLMIALGSVPGASLAQNVFFGSGGTSNSAQNVTNQAFGYHALFSNNTGSANTAIGYQSLHSNTTGITNTAIGMNALYSNTAGGGSTAIGFDALFSNTTGIDNTATGISALFYNTTGNYNTANGNHALLNNTIGSNNTANGYEPL